MKPLLNLYNPDQRLPPLVTIAGPSFGRGAKQIAAALGSWALGPQAYSVVDAYMTGYGNPVGEPLEFRLAPNTAVLLPPLLDNSGAAMAHNFNAAGIPMVAAVQAQDPDCTPVLDRWLFAADLVPEGVLLVSVGPPEHETPQTCLQVKGEFVGRVELL